MNKPSLPNLFHPVVILFIGLMVAQVIATIQVLLSNHALYHTLTGVSSAGYLSIPNPQVASRLQDFGTAFRGGLFFAFTIGTGISLAAMAAAWIWTQIFQAKRSALATIVIIWTFVLLYLNSSGFTLLPTLYFLFIAPVVFALSAKRTPSAASRSDQIKMLVHFMAIPVLALVWSTQYDRDMFLDLRDYLLLSNPYGRKFSSYYYTYTLYPAEAFKALNQKTIKTGAIKDTRPRSLGSRIENVLLAHDYLPLINAPHVDLVIEQVDQKLSFQAEGREVLRISIEDFFEDASGALNKFSAGCDRNAVFRQLTFLSLLVGFPLSIYVVVHAAIFYPGCFALGRSNSALTASILCLLCGILILFLFQSNRSHRVKIPEISTALASEKWQTRLAALKLIEQNGLEIADYRSYPVLQADRLPQERYWLVRTLAYSRRPEVHRVLVGFLNDENLNVRTMALHALGLRRDSRAIRPILTKIEKSDSWYEQMYGYRALRKLGWKQAGSQ